MKKLFYFAVAICLQVGFLHAEASTIQLKREKGYPEVSVRIDHPEGWTKREVSSWDLVLQKQGHPKTQIGIHFFRDRDFDVKDVSDIINHFDYLCGPLYTSKRNFSFHPTEENDGVATCSFVGKTDKGEEICTLFLTTSLVDGIIATWMTAGERWEECEMRPADLLYPFFE